MFFTLLLLATLQQAGNGLHCTGRRQARRYIHHPCDAIHEASPFVDSRGLLAGILPACLKYSNIQMFDTFFRLAVLQNEEKDHIEDMDRG